MILEREVIYRLRLAEGYLAEARQDFDTRRWRSCVSSAQLAAENAAKAVLALLGPVGRTHAPALALRRACDAGRFESIQEAATAVARAAEKLGSEIHAATDYGDEGSWRTPWEIFGEEDAQTALSSAEAATQAARAAVDGFEGKS